MRKMPTTLFVALAAVSLLSAPVYAGARDKAHTTKADQVSPRNDKTGFGSKTRGQNNPPGLLGGPGRGTGYGDRTPPK